MLTEFDIYGSASVLIQLHGEDAPPPLETAQRRQCPLWVKSGRAGSVTSVSSDSHRGALPA